MLQVLDETPLDKGERSLPLGAVLRYGDVGLVEGVPSFRVVGVQGEETTPQILLVREYAFRQGAGHTVVSQLLLADGATHALHSLTQLRPTSSRVISAALSPCGTYLAVILVAGPKRVHPHVSKLHVFSLTDTTQGVTKRLTMEGAVQFLLSNDSSVFLLVMTYTPFILQVVQKESGWGRGKRLCLLKVPSALSSILEVLHISTNGKYVMTVEIPGPNHRLTSPAGSRVTFGRVARRISAEIPLEQNQAVCIRLHYWRYDGHGYGLKELYRMPVTLPRRARMLPFSLRGNVKRNTIYANILAIQPDYPIGVLTIVREKHIITKIINFRRLELVVIQFHGPLLRSPVQSMSRIEQSFYKQLVPSFLKILYLPFHEGLFLLRQYSHTETELLVVHLPLLLPGRVVHAVRLPFQPYDLVKYHIVSNLVTHPLVRTELQAWKEKVINNPKVQLDPFCDAKLIYILLLRLVNPMHPISAFPDRYSFDSGIRLISHCHRGSSNACDTIFGLLSYWQLAKLVVTSRLAEIIHQPSKCHKDNSQALSPDDLEPYSGLFATPLSLELYTRCKDALDVQDLVLFNALRLAQEAGLQIAQSATDSSECSPIYSRSETCFRSSIPPDTMVGSVIDAIPSASAKVFPVGMPLIFPGSHACSPTSEALYHMPKRGYMELTSTYPESVASSSRPISTVPASRQALAFFKAQSLGEECSTISYSKNSADAIADDDGSDTDPDLFRTHNKRIKAFNAGLHGSQLSHSDVEKYSGYRSNLIDSQEETSKPSSTLRMTMDEITTSIGAREIPIKNELHRDLEDLVRRTECNPLQSLNSILLPTTTFDKTNPHLSIQFPGRPYDEILPFPIHLMTQIQLDGQIPLSYPQRFSAAYRIRTEADGTAFVYTLCDVFTQRLLNVRIDLLYGDSCLEAVPLQFYCECQSYVPEGVEEQLHQACYTQRLLFAKYCKAFLYHTFLGLSLIDFTGVCLNTGPTVPGVAFDNWWASRFDILWRAGAADTGTFVSLLALRALKQSRTAVSYCRTNRRQMYLFVQRLYDGTCALVKASARNPYLGLYLYSHAALLLPGVLSESTHLEPAMTPICSYHAVHSYLLVSSTGTSVFMHPGVIGETQVERDERYQQYLFTTVFLFNEMMLKGSARRLKEWKRCWATSLVQTAQESPKHPTMTLTPAPSLLNFFSYRLKVTHHVATKAISLVADGFMDEVGEGELTTIMQNKGSTHVDLDGSEQRPMFVSYNDIYGKVHVYDPLDIVDRLPMNMQLISSMGSVLEDLPDDSNSHMDEPYNQNVIASTFSTTIASETRAKGLTSFSVASAGSEQYKNQLSVSTQAGCSGSVSNPLMQTGFLGTRCYDNFLTYAMRFYVRTSLVECDVIEICTFYFNALLKALDAAAELSASLPIEGRIALIEVAEALNIELAKLPNALTLLKRVLSELYVGDTFSWLQQSLEAHLRQVS
ncbi:hypothetical protein GMRT_13212 [Giardia muris]|uniref:Uncharacterized protein n=1 Tax=Giardia muris TaxID=5742 RepID=A0A4Z1SUQ2_GIAMU|nr:hypothetical protein GMRT_13212 [Giardia muris]|eukprot:TNJ28685.1 hypothetical protein GMRT_13212 [Giardia muris]